MLFQPQHLYIFTHNDQILAIDGVEDRLISHIIQSYAYDDLKCEKYIDPLTHLIRPAYALYELTGPKSEWVNITHRLLKTYERFLSN